MIEPFGNVAGRFKKPFRPSRLGEAFDNIRQDRLVDQRLVLGAARQMRITEERDTIRLEADNLGDGALDTLPRLVRQSVNEVDIDRRDAGGSKAGDRPLCNLERLYAIDRLLY